MNIALLLEMAADGIGERVAIGPKTDGLSYREFLARVRLTAAHFAQHPAETIVYIGLNSETFPLVLFASGLAGKPFAPLNYRLPDADLRRILARTAPCVAVVDTVAGERVGHVDGVTLLSSSDLVTENGLFSSKDTRLGTADPDDTAVILYTSGTTGEPKGAMLRHRHLTSYVIGTVEFMGAGDEEATLISVPPYHIAGISAVLTSTYQGRRMVQLETFAAEDWIRTARDEAVTHAMLVPTMLGRVLDALEKTGERLPRLRHLSYGGGRMPVETITRALALLPKVNFVNAYGLTETSSTIAVLTPSDHRDAAASDNPQTRKRLGSVGRPLPVLELEIRTPNGETLPAGVPGEIWVRGEQVSGEYLGHRAVLKDGWFPTNDCGWLDDSGFLFVDGRLDDVIVRGGENISPGQIEDVLRSHPAVADVAIIGLPDREWGERVVAIVVPQADANADALRQWVRERLRSTRTPEEIHFRASLPYSETGKLLRRILKQNFSSNT
jgi:acyl-CoA synthetase (AMP-forming)/AMP-acid ligase II